MNNNRMLCWIDDNPSLMETVAYGIFPKLWRSHINSTVIFFGDSYKQEKEDRDFDNSICNDFKESLGKIARGVEFIDNIENVELIDLKDKQIKEIIQKWKSDDEVFNDRSDNFIEESEEDIEKIFNVIIDKCNIKDIDHLKYCYALDLDLLFEDYTRIVNKKIPIISMAIFYHLNNIKIPCFLYSSAVYSPFTFIRSWKEIYKNFYKQESIDNVKIIYRKELTEENFNPNALNDILEILGINKGDEKFE